MKEKNFSQPRVSPQQKMASVFLGLFLSLALLEGGLRLGGFIFSSTQEYGNLQSIKQKGAYRILCLGESTTQGQYPYLLEKALNQRNIGVRFSVIDKGVIGTDTSAILSQVDSYLAEYHPDMVVTMMGINDCGEHIPFEAVTTSKGILFIRSFRTYKLARLLWLHILTKAKEMGIFKKAPAESIFTEDFLKKAIKLNPKNAFAYVQLGSFYRDQGKFSQAEDAFKKAIELNPKNAFAYVELGWAYRVQGKFSQAEGLFKKEIKLNPENDYAYVELGLVYRFQGKFSQAEDALKKATELNPKNYIAYEDAGLFYRDQDKFPQAEEAFKTAIEIEPKNGRMFRAMSSLCEKMGKPELSKEYAKKVNELRSEHSAPVTVTNYRELKEILDEKGIKLVCVQYPVRHVEPLKKIFEKDEGVLFVDNERVFKEALKKAGYKEYFMDMFGGDFGHCTQKGNRLLAQNIANVILREVFNK